MHDTDVITGKSKQPNVKPCGAALDSIPVEPAFTSNPLNWKYSYFETDAYATGQGRSAAQDFDSAINASVGIQAIAQILIADDTERQNEDDGRPLSPRC